MLYQLSCMNALIDGITIGDFESDDEAIEFAANYEARCYRYDEDGTRTCIYEPGGEE